MAPTDHYDLIIIGTGLVGASVVRALRHSSLKIALITQQLPTSTPVVDNRHLVLSYGSRIILEALDLWATLSPQALTSVHISAQGQWGAWRLRADELKLPALGYVLSAQQLDTVVTTSIVAQENVTRYDGATVSALAIDDVTQTVTLVQGEQTKTLHASLVIAADGTQSTCRRLWNIGVTESHDDMMAWVSSIDLQTPATSTGYQRCTRWGTLAVLPYSTKRAAIICTAAREKIETLMALDDDERCQQLHAAFGYRVGAWRQVDTGVAYPVRTRIAQAQTVARGVLLGNAAHTLTPVAAQGFNLALQDLFALTTLLQQQWPDVPKILAQYETQRAPAQQRVIQATAQIQRYFNQASPFAFALGLGLACVDAVPELTRLQIDTLAGLTSEVKQVLRQQLNAA